MSFQSGKIDENCLKEYLELDKIIQSQSAVALVYKSKEKELKDLQEELEVCKSKLFAIQHEV